MGTQTVSKQERYLNIGYFLLSVLIIVWPALYNNFPLVTSDSGAYIHNGLRPWVPIDRPWGYSAFILCTSFGVSLWGVVLAQGVIAVWLLKRLCKILLGEFYSNPLLLCILILISFGTSAAWFISQIMPDAFSGLFVISLLLLYLQRAQPKWTYINLAIIALICLMHYSHLMILLLLIVVLFLFFFRAASRKDKSLIKKMTVLSVACYLLISTINVVKYQKFTLSPASHVFLMARFAENGILDKYLNENCAQKTYELCNCKDKLGERQWEFMWNTNVPFPHNKENGWLNSRKEYNSIIRDIFSKPKYWGLFALKCVEGTARQMGQIQIGEGLDPMTEGSSPYSCINELLHHELKEFRNTRQAAGQLPLSSMSWIITLSAAIICSFALSLRGKPDHKMLWRIIIAGTLILLLFNAFVTSTFSTVIGRLQSRMFWVLPMLAIIYIIGHKKQKDVMNEESHIPG
ncbi:hypothetical protein DBR32_00175 [Taibaiella sp. KBW10]|uniref:hypothetical protein n=1 Tax=Taibaiella sp. KBW10 TaxID=2153357 RepID=UPI000F594B48|nr:hypothetical protein [Taibaiella sp. KBW10]RQO32068.1 hypothetical protein DBR32_00175 [Taibaiella sp. KBW10]